MTARIKLNITDENGSTLAVAVVEVRGETKDALRQKLAIAKERLAASSNAVLTKWEEEER